MRKWFIDKKTTAAIGFTLSILVGIGVVSYLNFLNFKQTIDWVEHTHEVIETNENLLFLITNAETGQRGYLLTGEKRYLKPDRIAVEIALEIKKLRKLTSDNPNQQRRLDALEPLVVTELAELKQTINLRSKGLAAALQGVKIEREEQLMKEIRKLCDQIATEENQLLQVRSQQKQALFRSIGAEILLGSIVAFGFVIIIISIMVNQITRHRQAEEEALQKSEERFRATFNQAAVGIAHVGTDGKWLLVNQKLCDLVGYTHKELQSLTFQDITYPDDLDADLEYFRQLLANEIQTYSMEKRYIRQDTSLVWINLTVSLVRDPWGEPKYFISVVEDIYDRKQAEQQIKELNQDLERRVVERTAQLTAINQELEAFSYSVSHDLRTPLRTIDGFSQTLLERYAEQLDHKGKHYLQRVRAASQRMGQLIDDLLNLSRVTRSQMQRQKIDLTALVQVIAKELQQAQPERRIELIVAVGVMAQGDARLLRVVFENLLHNAWKFTAHQIQPRIEFGTLSQVGGTTIYFIRDNGAGFDLAYANKLFGAFQRLHTTDEFPGTGIGLVTVQRIINRHSGRIWAEGAVNQGATFYFTLEHD